MSFTTIDIGRESFTDQQAVTVKLGYTTNMCRIAGVFDTDEGGLHVLYVTLGLPVPVLDRFPRFTLSFDKLREVPLKCKDWFKEKSSEVLSWINFPEEKVQDLADKVVKHAVYLANLRNVEGHINPGYQFDATIVTNVFLSAGTVETYIGRDIEEEVITCSMCMNDLKNGMVISEIIYCGHIFHSSCVGPWLDRKRTCPNCSHRLDHICVGNELVGDLCSLNARFINVREPQEDSDISLLSCGTYIGWPESPDPCCAFNYLDKGIPVHASLAAAGNASPVNYTGVGDYGIKLQSCLLPAWHYLSLPARPAATKHDYN
ncbi:hypothetical protein POM88_052174 [Heracleum sosnowskyi]|uniref:RING-type E3 ubiquitin transferase n=1 Tax=Heracleum sosnowskyi TaxID=360622 RepID=A0AAD8LZA8_9APIA|nr:hypothetical protein POM88_052174 [Heracleum sosnowskyi]